jgi:hypothetical protein
VAVRLVLKDTGRQSAKAAEASKSGAKRKPEEGPLPACGRALFKFKEHEIVKVVCEALGLLDGLVFFLFFCQSSRYDGSGTVVCVFSLIEPPPHALLLAQRKSRSGQKKGAPPRSSKIWFGRAGTSHPKKNVKGCLTHGAARPPKLALPSQLKRQLIDDFHFISTENRVSRLLWVLVAWATLAGVLRGMSFPCPLCHRHRPGGTRACCKSKCDALALAFLLALATDLTYAS